jgi:FixJ family two-component response regulator
VRYDGESRRQIKADQNFATGHRARDCSCKFFLKTRRPTILATRKSVFVVDDDRSMLTSLRRLLRQHGFDATVFESANALLDHRDFSGAGCIVLDINLDGQSGIDLRRRLANEGVTAPVIYITGNDSQVNRSAAIESGCLAYLTKPFAARLLIESVERACGGGV